MRATYGEIIRIIIYNNDNKIIIITQKNNTLRIIKNII